METREEKNKKIRKKIIREEREKKTKVIIKIVTIVLSIILGVLCYGMFIGAKFTKVLEYKIEDQSIPTNFHGLKLVQISDILYDSLTKNDLDNLSLQINRLKPDILVFTGDLKRDDYSLSKDDIDTLEKFFQSLKSTVGRFAVIGDMDDDSFHVIMENSNFEILNNQEKILYYQDNEPIKLIGFDTNDLKEVKNEENYYTICLLHNPDKIDDINSSCNLALAGDTLGGEIRIPFTTIGLFDNHKYYSDYYKVDNTKLYISNGLGNNLNLRLFDRPTISLFRLTKY